MIFFLSPTINSALSGEPSPNLVNALQHLADSRRCGQNEILGDRDVLRAVSNCTHLSAPARSIYAKLSEASTQMLHLLAECDLHIFVTEQPAVCVRETLCGRVRITLSAEHLARHQRLAQSPVLLCENLDDCVFMTWIGSLYATWNRLPNRIHFDVRSGGGHTTAHVYEAILQGREAPCICIADSDLKYEGDTSLGGTAAALLAADSQNDTTLAHLHVLECQEAENLIPASILADVYASNPRKLDASTDLESVQKDATHELWRYYDVKNGLRMFELLHPLDLRFQASWSRAFGSVSDIEMGFCSGCSGRDRCEDKDSCTVYLARGFGTTVLSDTVDSFFAIRSAAEVRRRLPINMKSYWSVIGRLVWSWGTVGYRMAIC